MRVSLGAHDDIVSDIRCLTHRDMARVCIIVVSDVISVLKSLQCCLCQCDDKWDVFMDGQRIQMTMPLKNVSDEKMRDGYNVTIAWVSTIP